ncbi:hypothetical protein NAI71_09580, partial [Francisella tularensis subsp. holarctica]|nr:hypothetical protein [Francisella tularensis subsp. holarctica]
DSIDYTSFTSWFIFLCFLMLYVAVIITIYSMCYYLYVAFKSVFGASDNYLVFLCFSLLF